MGVNQVSSPTRKLWLRLDEAAIYVGLHIHCLEKMSGYILE